MRYYVYSIGEVVEPDDSLTQEKKDNLGKIIRDVLGVEETGQPGEIRKYKIEEGNAETHKITYFRHHFLDGKSDESKLSEFMKSLAQDLLNAELVKGKEGELRRHKRITPGILIIKYSKSKLLLLKLEETNSIDKKTYETRSSFMSDKRYFKAAVITGESIYIIDNSRRVANYWAEKFLKLIQVRDNITNTTKLAKLLTEDKLISSMITDEEERKTTKRILQQLAFEQSYFVADRWLDEINNELPEGVENYATIQDVFAPDALEQLDDMFQIDKKIISKKLKTILTVAENITIQAINIDLLIRRNEMNYIDGIIRITVPIKNRDEVEKIFNR